MGHCVTEMCTFLWQNDALWGMGLVQCWICATGLTLARKPGPTYRPVCHNGKSMNRTTISWPRSMGIRGTLHIYLMGDPSNYDKSGSHKAVVNNGSVCVSIFEFYVHMFSAGYLCIDTCHIQRLNKAYNVFNGWRFGGFRNASMWNITMVWIT